MPECMPSQPVVTTHEPRALSGSGPCTGDLAVQLDGVHLHIGRRWFAGTVAWIRHGKSDAAFWSEWHEAKVGRLPNASCD